MIIKAINSIKYDNTFHQPGAEIAVPNDIGDSLIRRGKATLIESAIEEKPKRQRKAVFTEDPPDGAPVKPSIEVTE